jgi:hypothetical protein
VQSWLRLRAGCRCPGELRRRGSGKVLWPSKRPLLSRRRRKSKQALICTKKIKSIRFYAARLQTTVHKL